MAKATSVVTTILGEAGGKTPEERYEDMRGVASAIVNRAIKEGVSIEAVVSARGQFDAYGAKLPPGTERYLDLAQKALDDVLTNGPIHKATYFATPSKVGNLPSGLKAETETAGHQYFSDPEDRAITVNSRMGGSPPSIGTVADEGNRTGLLASYAPTDSVDASPFDSLFGGFPATAGTFEEPAQATAQQSASDDFGALGVERTGFVSPFGALGDRATSEFGSRDRPRTPLGLGSANHQGIDLSLEPGASGYSAQSIGGGVVTRAGPVSGYGNMVELTHDDGMVSRYGHLSQIGNVNVGDRIATGTPIGSVGMTGGADGPHLHLETIDQQGVAVDPRSVIDFNPNPTVPTPTFAERVAPGQQISDIANQAVQPAQDTFAAHPTISDPRFGNSTITAAGNTALGFGNFDVIGATQPDPTISSNPVMADAGQIVTTPEQQADMQTRANFQNEVNMARGRVSSVTPETAAFSSPVSGAIASDPVAGGIVSASLPTISNDQMAAVSNPVGASIPSTSPVSFAASQYGLQPRSVMTAPVSAAMAGDFNLSPSTPADADYSLTGIANPGLTRANQYGLEPTRVQSTVPDYTAPATQTVTGPVTSQIADAQKTQAEQQAAARSQTSQFGMNARNVSGALVGGLLGSPFGPIGGMVGAVLGHEAAAGRGLFNRDGTRGGIFGRSPDISINNLGTGPVAAYGAWNGPVGSMGIASDGSRITNYGGFVSRVDPNGVESRFSKDGGVVGGPHSPGIGGLLGSMFGGFGDDTDTDTESETDGSTW